METDAATVQSYVDATVLVSVELKDMSTPLPEILKPFAPVVINASFALQVEAPWGEVVVPQPSLNRHFVFTLKMFLSQESRLESISSVLSGVIDTNSVIFIAEYMVNFLEETTKAAFDGGKSIEASIRFTGKYLNSSGGWSHHGGVPESMGVMEIVDYEGGQLETCTICFERFEVGEKVSRMPCSHIFHVACFTRLLGSSRRCPLCRRLMPARSVAFPLV
ncbi:E3 ubiquitin-protein ligase [Canna indica]|uniref:E3 ubiquitin-protein ligase n=1 Tax=Canna indica TaxID=4628 RepID=A0AAQ3QK80_9LILI|nr:E3 ubiquitin-protein ligase [Canna indica]